MTVRLWAPAHGGGGCPWWQSHTQATLLSPAGGCRWPMGSSFVSTEDRDTVRRRMRTVGLKHLQFSVFELEIGKRFWDSWVSWQQSFLEFWNTAKWQVSKLVNIWWRRSSPADQLWLMIKCISEVSFSASRVLCHACSWVWHTHTHTHTHSPSSGFLPKY